MTQFSTALGLRSDGSWIYHGIKGTNSCYDKSSVAIEFANELGLALDGDRLYGFGMNTPNTVYTAPFLAFDWRDYSYFASSTTRRWTRASNSPSTSADATISSRRSTTPSTTFDFPRCFQVATIVRH